MSFSRAVLERLAFFIAQTRVLYFTLKTAFGKVRMPALQVQSTTLAHFSSL
jgi:hypothetical protein